MRKRIHLWAMASALALGGVTTANATTYIIPKVDGVYDANLTVNSDGTLSVLGDPTHYNAVLQQDKLFQNFTGLVLGGSVDFGFGQVDGQDLHTITFGSSAFARHGAAIGYDVSVIPGSPKTLLDTFSALVQTRGRSHLYETLSTNVGSAGPIDFIQVGGTPSGTQDATFAAGATSVHVLDTLTILPGGSSVNAIENDFTELLAPGPVPGASIGGLIALLGLGLLARSRGPSGPLILSVNRGDKTNYRAVRGRS